MIRTTYREHTVTRKQDHLPVSCAQPDAACRGQSVSASRLLRKTVGTVLKVGAFVALAMLLLEPLGALADNYKRGNYSCTGFAEAEWLHRSEPENVYYRLAYAHCLIARGGQDHDALGILHSIADGDHRARVEAAFMIAEYIETGGEFGDSIDENNINEAIEAYGKVVFLIRLAPDYPAGLELMEEESQIELRSHYRLALLYYAKYKYGGSGTDHVHLMRSPGYDGSTDLKTFPDYAPYTINSLERAIEFADQCLALPMKWYFEPDLYEELLAACRAIKDAATAILPLERKRLVLLDTVTCSNDLLKCVEYEYILDEINAIITQTSANIDEIFGE